MSNAIEFAPLLLCVLALFSVCGCNPHSDQTQSKYSHAENVSGNTTGNESSLNAINVKVVWKNTEEGFTGIIEDLPGSPASERNGFPYMACIIDRSLLVFSERGTCGSGVEGILLVDDSIPDNALFNHPHTK